MALGVKFELCLSEFKIVVSSPAASVHSSTVLNELADMRIEPLACSSDKPSALKTEEGSIIP